MIVVSDTSAITNLWQIQELDLLNKLFGEIIIPPAVETELGKIPAQQKYLAKIPWLRKVEPLDDKRVKQLMEQLVLVEQSNYPI